MSRKKLRVRLYSVSIVVAAALLFAGFGITIPPDPGTRLGGASMLAAMGDYDNALAACDKVLSEHPDNVEARVFRATFLAQAERYEEAIVAYDDALLRVDGDMKRSLRVDRASVLLLAGKDQLYANERAALADEGVDKYVHLLDGIAARERKEWDAAKTALAAALELDPENRTARSLLVDVLVSSGGEDLGARRFQAAANAYCAALEIDPQRADVALRAAEVLISLEEEADAVAALKEAGLRHRGVGAMLFRAATSLLERGEKQDAFHVLATAVKADATAVAALFAKSPAWEKARKDATLQELVSSGDTNTQSGLPVAGPVIGSSRQQK